MTELQLRRSYVKVMYEWYKAGLKMSNGSHKVIIDTYNKHKPLPNGYKVKYTDSWCATTVSAAAIKAEKETGVKFTSIIPKECSCPRQIELFKKLGEWEENDAYVPTVGDIIYYDWQDNGKGDNKGVPDHVGVVYSVSAKRITLIEGNKSRAMGLRTISVNGKYIRGFGRPKYSKLVTKSSKKSDTKKVVEKKTTTTKKHSSTTSTTKKATTSKPKFKAGAKFTAKALAVYASASASKSSANKSGTYYIWDTEVTNGRVRITNSASNAGKSNQITGWVSYAKIKSQFS